ncbi:MAG: 2-dehydropantoate 2-reductase [Candidatus Eremiobacteraeota bacterium]|nr:2-dehydropantoate 2-reductase [Candidatus Eremiobacteraeota bacterium]
MKIGILGAGAIGLTFAAALARVHDVVLLARRSAVAEMILRDGVALEAGDGARRVAVRATTDAGSFAGCDAVIVAVKAYATANALAPLRGVLPPHALVATVQNGIDNVETVREALPGARAIAGSTTQGAVLLGDGRVRTVNRGTTTFGRDDTAAPTSGELAAAFIAAGLDARVADDVNVLLWRKLVIVAAINPLGALTSSTNGAVVSDPELVPLARALAIEAAAVAKSEGVDPGDPWAAVEAAARATAANRNSMLQDLDAGRPTEIDAISGAIVSRAQNHGIAVPVTETMLRLVRAREQNASDPAHGASR